MPETDVASLLSLFAASTEANIDQLQTWSGSYEMVESSSIENPWFSVRPEGSDAETTGNTHRLEKRQLHGDFLRSQTVEGEFVADLRGDRLYTSYRHVGNTTFQQVDGDAEIIAPVEPATAYHQDAILTSSDFLHVRQNARFTRVVGFPELPEPPGGYRMVERESPEQGHRLTRQSTVFDPRRLLESGGRRPHFVFDAVADWVERNELNVSLTREENDSYQIQYEFSNGDITAKTIESIQGEFLLTESTLTNETRGVFRNSWDYVFEGDLAVPVRHEYTHHDADGRMKRGRATNLRDLRINEPVSDEEFLASRFNPGPLDRLVDRIEDKVDVFIDAETVVSADDFRRELLPEGTKVVDFAKVVPVMHAEVAQVGGFGFRGPLVLANLCMIAVVGGQRSR